jgi:hypothetical protein
MKELAENEIASSQITKIMNELFEYILMRQLMLKQQSSI